ncbi:helix-loop-helix DNA-binding domain-containing protein [Calycina marina]|uniref:Helix-loop-helix DNA-binding domain-containing protein n=1 Tax=Calycina marina TaxID=1763456 RepID=A0A9P7ZAX9_9HELO|nr:helix-loop-helix DNA-binding domain-containing protein [Calycina marina]
MNLKKEQKLASSPTISTSSPTREHSGSAGGDLDEKPRLSEREKKANHIASEQKRRQAIRDGFDRLTELVPNLHGQGRSENIVLSKTVTYMKEQMEIRRKLIEQVEALGGKVDDSMRP